MFTKSLRSFLLLQSKAFVALTRSCIVGFGLMNNSEFVSNGKFTEVGLNELRQKLPHTDLASFENDPDINKLGDLFTVGAIVNYVDGKLNAA